MLSNGSTNDRAPPEWAGSYGRQAVRSETLTEPAPVSAVTDGKKRSSRKRSA